MTRKISITEIPDVMEDAVVFLVAATTLEWTARVKKATPVRVVYEGEPRGGGQLRNAWQTDIKPTTGTVTNNYPVFCCRDKCKITSRYSKQFIL